MRRRLALAFVGLLLAAPATVAAGCDCDAPFDPRPEFEAAALVFEGFVLAELPGDPGAGVADRRRFRVRRVWKDEAAPDPSGAPGAVLLASGALPSGCEPFEPAPMRMVVVFADRDPQGRLRALPCGRSRVSVAWLTDALDRLRDEGAGAGGPAAGRAEEHDTSPRLGGEPGEASP